jgi:hypothetical protein
MRLRTFSRRSWFSLSVTVPSSPSTTALISRSVSSIQARDSFLSFMLYYLVSNLCLTGCFAVGYCGVSGWCVCLCVRWKDVCLCYRIVSWG